MCSLLQINIYLYVCMKKLLLKKKNYVICIYIYVYIHRERERERERENLVNTFVYNVLKLCFKLLIERILFSSAQYIERQLQFPVNWFAFILKKNSKYYA